jgi:hypothetical protein
MLIRAAHVYTVEESAEDVVVSQGDIWPRERRYFGDTISFERASNMYMEVSEKVDASI